MLHLPPNLGRPSITTFELTVVMIRKVPWLGRRRRTGQKSSRDLAIGQVSVYRVDTVTSWLPCFYAAAVSSTVSLSAPPHTSHSSHSSHSSHNSSTAEDNCKDIITMKSSCDYFSLKPVRGLSPTTSLAADLSQNFHIEQRYVGSFCPRHLLPNREARLSSLRMKCKLMLILFTRCRSAQFATPRRSLFSAALCGAIGGRGKRIGPQCIPHCCEAWLTPMQR